MKGDRAVIATEFALIAPVMILLWVGVVELATAHLVARKVEAAAQSAADIIAQDADTNIARLDDIEAAIKAILAPYPTTTVGYQFASIVEDSGGINTIGWHNARGTLAGAAAPSLALGANLNNGEDSVIVVTVSYVHTPIIFNPSMFGWLAPNITIDKTVFARPRRVPAIPCDDCP